MQHQGSSCRRPGPRWARVPACPACPGTWPHPRGQRARAAGGGGRFLSFLELDPGTWAVAPSLSGPQSPPAPTHTSKLDIRKAGGHTSSEPGVVARVAGLLSPWEGGTLGLATWGQLGGDRGLPPQHVTAVPLRQQVGNSSGPLRLMDLGYRGLRSDTRASPRPRLRPQVCPAEPVKSQLEPRAGRPQWNPCPKPAPAASRSIRGGWAPLATGSEPRANPVHLGPGWPRGLPEPTGWACGSPLGSTWQN